MNQYFMEFIDRFKNNEINNKQLFDIISEYPDYDFFTELLQHLLKDGAMGINEMNEIYGNICWSYFCAKKYFKEH